MAPRHVDAILLIYHHPVVRDAPTIMEHVTAFEKYSRFPVVKVNTEYGFDPLLLEMQFPVIVFHYSVFVCDRYQLNDAWYEFLDTQSEAYKIAFFQDEFQGCVQRFEFLNRWSVQCVYSLYEPQYWDQLYRQHTSVRTIRSTLTGYVDERALAYRRRWVKPGLARPIDVGYRARKLPFYMGAGAQEKWWVARDFLERSAGLDLKTNISWQEEDRIYGAAWYRFIARCHGMLGAESGVSISDPDGTIIEKYRKLMAQEPTLTFEQVTDRLLRPFENNIPLRTISPRSFEAAALGTCQILLEGRYNDILIPWRHYLPLKRDFANFDDVMQAFTDEATRRQVTEAAFSDLVASGEYTYKRFIQQFEQSLVDDSGWRPGDLTTGKDLQKLFSRRQWKRMASRVAYLVPRHGLPYLLKLGRNALRRKSS